MAPTSSHAQERPTLPAGVLATGLRVDGVLDEPEWASAPASTELVMVEPRQGDRSNGRATLKVLAGPKALGFGIRCEDPEPAGIVSFTKERDGAFEFEDHVVVVLDPFQDGRSGYVFAVNPGGARFDAPVNWRLESGDRVELNVVPVGERLVLPFEVADGVVIPEGSYDWRRYRVDR